MSMVIFLILICVLQATVSLFPPPPQNVQLISENFRHVLTWENNNLSASVRYKKMIYSIERQWESVPKCFNVTTQRCELTEYFTDVIGEYVGSVQSVYYNKTSAFVNSPMFNPLEQTRLGPPIVHVTACNKCVNVSISPPISHIPSADQNHTIPMLQDHVYPILEYTITVSTENEYTRQLKEFAAKEKFFFVIENLTPNSNYCVSVNASASSNLNEEQIPSNLQCVITEPHHLEVTSVSKTLIGISVGAVLLILIGLLLVLIALDRAGYIFLGKHFLPKTLKSVPQSESRFYESKDVCSSALVEPVEVIKKTEPKEEYDSEDEKSGPGYARRKNVLDSDQSTTSGMNDCVLQYSASSSAVDSSGQGSGSSADTGKSSEPTLLIDIDERRSSNTNVVPAGFETSPNLLVNMSDTYNINLNSVSVGDPENLWTGLCQEPSSKKEPETGATLQGPVLVVLGSRGFPLFPNEVEASCLPESEDCISEEEVDSDNSQIDSNEQFVSDYMRRER